MLDSWALNLKDIWSHLGVVHKEMSLFHSFIRKYICLFALINSLFSAMKLEKLPSQNHFPWNSILNKSDFFWKLQKMSILGWVLWKTQNWTLLKNSNKTCVPLPKIGKKCIVVTKSVTNAWITQKNFYLNHFRKYKLWKKKCHFVF